MILHDAQTCWLQNFSAQISRSLLLGAHWLFDRCSSASLAKMDPSQWDHSNKKHETIDGEPTTTAGGGTTAAAAGETTDGEPATAAGGGTTAAAVGETTSAAVANLTKQVQLQAKELREVIFQQQEIRVLTKQLRELRTDHCEILGMHEQEILELQAQLKDQNEEKLKLRTQLIEQRHMQKEETKRVKQEVEVLRQQLIQVHQWMGWQRQ